MYCIIEGYNDFVAVGLKGESSFNTCLWISELHLRFPDVPPLFINDEDPEGFSIFITNAYGRLDLPGLNEFLANPQLILLYKYGSEKHRIPLDDADVLALTNMIEDCDNFQFIDALYIANRCRTMLDQGYKSSIAHFEIADLIK